jgi:hypothetical protein
MTGRFPFCHGVCCHARTLQTERHAIVTSIRVNSRSSA